MMHFYSRRSLLPCLIIALVFTDFSYAQNFYAKGLSGVNLENRTSFDFGSNKLNVSKENNSLFEYSVARNNADEGQGTYTLTDIKVQT